MFGAQLAPYNLVRFGVIQLLLSLYIPQLEGDDVRKLTGLEVSTQISSDFTIQADLEIAGLVTEEIIDRHVAVGFDYKDGTEEVYLCGYVTHVSGRIDDGSKLATLTIQSWASQVREPSPNMHFRNKTFLEIVEELYAPLRSSGLCHPDFEFLDEVIKLRHSKRLKYRRKLATETRFQFLCRLMEEQGLFSYFRHEVTKTSKNDSQLRHTLVFADHHKAGFTSCTLPLDPSKRGIPMHCCITSLTAEDFQYIRKITVTAYDPGDETRLIERTFGDHTARSEMVEHLSSIETIGDLQEIADLRLDEAQTRAVTLKGEGCAHSLLPGFLLDITGYSSTKCDGAAFVTTVTHKTKPFEGYPLDSSALILTTRFEGVPLKSNAFELRRFVAPRKVSKPMMRSWEWARIVGLNGDTAEIRFHWERLNADGRFEPVASAALRPRDRGHGSLKLDQEVAVEFQDDDPDRPFIRVPNETHVGTLGGLSAEKTTVSSTDRDEFAATGPATSDTGLEDSLVVSGHPANALAEARAKAAPFCDFRE